MAGLKDMNQLITYQYEADSMEMCIRDRYVWVQFQKSIMIMKSNYTQGEWTDGNNPHSRDAVSYTHLRYKSFYWFIEQWQWCRLPENRCRFFDIEQDR